MLIAAATPEQAGIPVQSFCSAIRYCWNDHPKQSMMCFSDHPSIHVLVYEVCLISQRPRCVQNLEICPFSSILYASSAWRRNSTCFQKSAAVLELQVCLVRVADCQAWPLCRTTCRGQHVAASKVEALSPIPDTPLSFQHI